MASDGTIKITTELDNNAAQKSMSKFESIAKAGLKGVVTAATAASAAIGGIAAYSIKVGSSFEEGMSKVSAISGATGSDLEALSDKAKEMGAKTKFSATEAASAFEYMAMAGWKTEDMLSGIEGIMNLAAASGEDLALTSDIVTDALTAFGLTAADSGRFADVLAAASSNANTNVSMMGETFKYVAPVAGALGYSAEDTAVAIGLMANSGVKAGQAGTSLRAMLSRLAKPTEQVEAAMERLGISLTNSDGSMKSLNEIMIDLRNSFSGLSEAERASEAATLAGQEAMSGMLAIVTASDADFNKLKDSIYNCDGATEKMAATMQDNLKGSITILGSVVEGFGIQIYEKMQEPLRDVVETGIECVDGLSDAFKSGGVKGVVEELGSQFDELTNRIAETSDVAAGIVGPFKMIAKSGAELTKTALVPMAKGAKLLARNLDMIIPLAAGSATAFGGLKIINSISKWYKTASAASAAYAAVMATEGVAVNASSVAHILLASTMSASELAVGVFSGEITLATAAEAAMMGATNLLGTALNALPLVAVTGAIGGLVAATISIKEKYAQYEEITVNLTEKQEELINKTNELSEAYNASKEAKEEAIQTAVTEYGHYSNLVSELQKITDENGQVKDGYQDRAKVITGELSSALGTEITMTDGVIDNYQEMISTIDQVIQKQKAQAIMSAYQEDFAEATTKSAEALASYTQLQKESEAAANAVEEAQEKYNAALEAYENSAGAAEGRQEMLREKLAEYGQELDSAKAHQDELNAETEEAKTVLEGYQEQIDTYNTLSEAVASESAEKIEAALQQITSGYETYTAESLANSEEARQAMLEQATTAVDGLTAIQNGAVKVGDELTQSTANSAAQAIGEFSKMPGGVSKAIQLIGPEASKSMLSALAQANLDGLLNEESKADLKSFIDGFSGLKPETQATFAQAWYGALEGLEGFDQIKNPAEEGVEEFLESLRIALDEHSPSKKTEEIFRLAMEGAAQGVESGKEGVLSKAGEFIIAFLGKFTEGAQQIGSSIMSFFGIGISSQTGNSKLAGKANADAANAGAASVNPAKTGSAFGTRLGEGISKASALLTGKGKGLSTSANTGAASVNPSGTGDKFGNLYASGIGGKSGDARTKGKALADSAKSGVGTADGASLGSNFGAGFVRGIGSWIKSAASKAAEMANSALNAAKRALDSHSPSKKAKKIGKTLPQGFGGGIDEDGKIAVKAAEEMSASTLDAIDVDSISEKLQGLNIPDTMSRIYAAVDDRQSQVAERVTAAVSARENLAWMNRQIEQKAHISEEDIKKLAKEFASAASEIMAKEMDGMGFYARERELFRLIREVRQ